LTDVKIKRWMNVAEVAEWLRRSVRTVRRYIDEGKLTGGKPDRGSQNGIMVWGPSVAEYEEQMKKNMLEDPLEVDKEMEEIMVKKGPGRKVHSKGFVKNW